MKRTKEQLAEFAADWNSLKAFPSRQSIADKYGVSIAQTNNIADTCRANGIPCISRAKTNNPMRRLWDAVKAGGK